MTEAVRPGLAGLVLMGGTGAAVVSTGMPDGKTKVGETVKVPYFTSIGEIETLAADGDALTPTLLTESNEEATVKHVGKAFGITKWARSGVGDPYKEGSRQVLVAIQRGLDKELIDAAKNETGWTDYVYDRSGTGDGKITYDSIVETVGKFGDETEDLACLVMHSKVYRDLLMIKDSTGRPMWVDLSGVGGPRLTALNIPIKISDRLAAVATVYPSLLLRKGALAAWIDDQATEIVTDFDILTNEDIAAIHMYLVTHRYKHVDGMTKPGVAILKTK
jgi:hypothetical protein